MSNGDMPAMPQSVSRSDDGVMISSSDFVGCEGLTKREYFAALALQGIASDSDFGGDAEDAAALACDYADELLLHLENTK